MKKALLLFALSLSSTLCGFHVGAGFACASIDETFQSDLFTNQNRSGVDTYDTHVGRLAPMVMVGQRFFLCRGWTLDLQAEWKYLNYRTPNVNSSVGQILPNATFSSINFFGPDVERDFTSKTSLHNEVILMPCLGKEVFNGTVYVGVGPVFLDATNRIYVSSVHTPNGTGDHLISTSVKRHRGIWGGAARIGYQYFLHCNIFLNIGYTYLQTGKCRFGNSVNMAILNGSSTPGPTTLFLERSIRFTVQELFCSLNLLF